MTGDPRTILIVDDDPLQRKSLAIRLRHMGFKVLTAEDGGEALEKARHADPDAVVSDVLMPRLDGFRLCQILRQDSRLASVPIVLTSSAAIEEADRSLARSMGANAFVVRTPEDQEVIDALQESLAAPAPPPLRDQQALLAEWRDRFLAEGIEESRKLRRQMEWQLDKTLVKRFAHRWAGMGGMLGFVQLSQRAYEVEMLLETPLGGVASRLSCALEDIGRLFAGAAQGKDGVSETRLELTAALSGRRIALLGFDSADAARLSSSLRHAGGSPSVLPVPAAPPGSPALLSFDLLILHLGREAEHSSWTEPERLVENQKPLLVIGRREVLLETKAAVREHASDFLFSPWFSEEVVIRACRALRQGCGAGADFSSPAALQLTRQQE